MYNFFVEKNQTQDNKIIIENQDAKHIMQVLRMQKGEEIYICDKQTEKRFLAKIENFEKEKVICYKSNIKSKSKQEEDLF